MESSSSKSESKSSSKVKEPKPAEAPGPIDPAHESGSWEQTLAEQEARDKARADRRSKVDRSESRVLPPSS